MSHLLSIQQVSMIEVCICVDVFQYIFGVLVFVFEEL